MASLGAVYNITLHLIQQNMFFYISFIYSLINQEKYDKEVTLKVNPTLQFNAMKYDINLARSQFRSASGLRYLTNQGSERKSEQRVKHQHEENLDVYMCMGA